MEDNPSEFVRIALDVADRQRLPMLKCGSAKFLENICDKQDGLLLETGFIFLELIDFIIKGKVGEISGYTHLSQVYDQVSLFKSCSDEELLDIALTSLTVLSYALPKKENFSPVFMKVIDSTTQQIMDRKSTLLDSRLALFLGYYIDILYSNDETTFLSVLKMLVMSLNSPRLACAH